MRKEGDYTGTGEYDADMNYVGPAPTEESMAANGSWTGGYREDGSYDGASEYDRDGNYVGSVEDAQNSDEADSSGASEDGGTSGNESNSDSTDTGDSGEQSYDTGDTDDYSGEQTDSGYSDEQTATVTTEITPAIRNGNNKTTDQSDTDDFVRLTAPGFQIPGCFFGLSAYYN